MDKEIEKIIERWTKQPIYFDSSLGDLSSKSKKWIRNKIVDLILSFEFNEEDLNLKGKVWPDTIRINWKNSGVYFVDEMGRRINYIIMGRDFSELKKVVNISVNWEVIVDECKIGVFDVGFDTIKTNRHIKIDFNDLINMWKADMREIKLKKIIK